MVQSCDSGPRIFGAEQSRTTSCHGLEFLVRQSDCFIQRLLDVCESGRRDYNPCLAGDYNLCKAARASCKDGPAVGERKCGDSTLRMEFRVRKNQKVRTAYDL